MERASPEGPRQSNLALLERVLADLPFGDVFEGSERLLPFLRAEDWNNVRVALTFLGGAQHRSRNGDLTEFLSDFTTEQAAATAAASLALQRLNRILAGKNRTVAYIAALVGLFHEARKEAFLKSQPSNSTSTNGIGSTNGVAA